MKKPLLRHEYDQWRYSRIGKWFFEVRLQEHVDEKTAALVENLAVEKYDECVKNAGFIQGVEYAINEDPFWGVRNEDEAESHRETGVGPIGL